MAKIAYSQVVDLLLDRFPEFKETEEYRWVADDLELPYAVWGAFGRRMTTYMRRLPADRVDSDEMVDRVFDFANEMMDCGDDNTQTIVVVELFENFYMYRRTLELGRRKLKPEHVVWLEKQGHWLGTCGLHYEGGLVEPERLAALHWLLDGCSWDVRVRGHVHAVGTRPVEPLRLESNDARLDLEMDPGAGPRFTFFGDGSREADARALLGEFSERLAGGDIAHCIRLYRVTARADIVLQEFRHRWPPDEVDDG